MAQPFLGQLMLVGFNFPPRGWAFCDGQLLSISQNQALFSLLGTTFGGDGRTTFGLPDLRGRKPIHVGQGPGLNNYVWGQKAGAESVTITNSTMASHTHMVSAYGTNSDQLTPVGHTWSNDDSSATATYSDAKATGTMNSKSITNTGGSQPHTNLQPFLSLYFCIALQGIFPSRN